MTETSKFEKLGKLSHSDRQTAHFDGEKVQHYEEVYDYRSKTFKWMIEIILPLLKNTKSILDIGTGTGDLVRAIKTEGTVTGLDISNDMLKVAKEKNQDGCFVQGDAYKLPFNDKTYDAVTYKYALHHLDQPIKALTEAFRVLKDNGCIIIADVASFKEEVNHLIFNKLNSLREPANYEYRTIKTIEQLLKVVSFNNVTVVQKDFDLVLEDWLNNFYNPQDTINLVLNSSDSFKNSIKLKELKDGKHQITLSSFIINAVK